MKIAVISDLHFSRKPSGPDAGRVGKYADIFLLRAVRRLKRFLRPDLVFIGGDLLDEPDSPDAASLLLELKNILALLDMPVIVIPGNHDPAPDAFYKVMPKPAEYLDVGRFRFIPFPYDPQTEGWNARRDPAELAHMKRLATSHNGPVVSLQHVPLFPAESCDCPYNYENSSELVTAMRAAGVKLSLSGHYHKGFQIIDQNGLSAVAAPALCESPFRFLTLDLDGDGKIVRTETHSLCMPEELHLTDYHVHTRFAYCNENMDVGKALELATLFKLELISFSEHSSHLYFNIEDYRNRLYHRNIIPAVNSETRIDEYFSELDRYSGQKFMRGLEIDIDYLGKPVVRAEDLKRANLRIGAVHYMEAATGDNSAITDEFMYQTRSILSADIDILAHPFRVFLRRKLPPPKELYIPVAEMLKESGTAAEVNFHTNTPDPEFFLACIERGVEIAFGSDAHNLYEVGEFYPHLELIKSIGFSGKTADILFKTDLII
ncbi:MAG: metallophosphoesterase [Victivallales bacterium]|jgi:histidinol phosphatase-like PHP family hydrolase